MALSGEQQLELQAQLQQAVIACNERCLYQASKWAAELLDSFPSSANDLTNNDASDTDVDDDSPLPNTPPTSHDRKEARLEAKELPRFLMAKSFFDCREYDRCAAVFLPQNALHGSPSSSQPQSTPKRSPLAARKTTAPQKSQTKGLSQRALFLSLYARYMSGEKRKNEDSEMLLGPQDGGATSNTEIAGILVLLEEYFNTRGGIENLSNSQGWLDYLYGICLIKSKSEQLSKQWLLRSININPYNWSAWLELASLVGSAEELQQIAEHLPRNIITFMFHIYCSQELYLTTQQTFTTIQQIENIFPHSAWLQTQKALLHYHAKDYTPSCALFEQILKSHPHRLDGMEWYSNMLYVLPDRPRLASLAAMANNTDKFRPETCCIIGNYYSLISEHEKAVTYFRRALQLDRQFTMAFTLMGHEYIELKNTQAAIESYRRAVDCNRKDYRAWYGLGQGYEMLECHSYSLFYYQRAAALQSYDPKMWMAVGEAYAKCGKVASAIKALKRALVVGSQMDAGSSFGSDPLAGAVGGALDPEVLYKIALLYERESNTEEAAAYMELTLAQEEGEEGPEGGDGGLGVTMTTSKARLWLARYSYSLGEWQRTMELANELCQDGVEVEEAKGLVRDVRSRLALAAEEEERGG